MLLPAMTVVQRKELIPVNKYGERIDPYHPSPPQEAWDIYQRRLKQHKLCNKHHVGGTCTHPACPFDHTPVEKPTLDVLFYILRQYPCPRGGECRLQKCVNGHICQKDGCKGMSCRFTWRAHILDLDVTEWVLPMAAEDEDQANGYDIH